ncbi:hypothetical protein [Exiguobacterium sp. AB2]|uniref:hypothetical protein n=1 Tax=Exiguobacterium sp. AB2 TaxID=1484479 RepID=UPI0004A95BAE|nr:hypothetical protein [Exiguobacterium sp. AB2]KDN59298.1 hypothetical protein DI14_05535 [Exiguobacterium sp. AB2]
MTLNFLISNGKIPSLPSIETVKQALIKSLGDRYKDDCIILIPNGSDGISKEEGNGFAQNLNFMKEMVDIIQTINKKDKLFYLNECRSIYDKTYPCISGSDAHSFERFTEYEIEKTTWIKADKTFYGLKSILFEPEERVCIQSNSPDLKLKSKVIDYIKLPQKDFDGQHIYFNSGMNVIVGGRSSGKSLLLSLLAKKVGNVSSLKRNNNLYEQLIQEKLEDTNAFLLDGSATNGDTLIEFFYQDKLQEIASDVNKRNKFIIEIIGEDNQNRQMILDQKIKVVTEINIKMMRERQSNLTLVSTINKFQTEHQIKDNIEEVKSKLKSLYSDNKFQDDDFEKLNREMQNQISNESRLNQEIKNYESIKQINFYALNSSLPADKRPIINSIHELYKSQLNKLNTEIEGELNRKIDSINVSLEKLN